MGRRQVSGQQNVSYSTGTRRETWSHVTTGKLTVAYAAQTVSNFGANREFRTSTCLGDTAGKLVSAFERISSLNFSRNLPRFVRLPVDAVQPNISREFLKFLTKLPPNGSLKPRCSRRGYSRLISRNFVAI